MLRVSLLSLLLCNVGLVQSFGALVPKILKQPPLTVLHANERQGTSVRPTVSLTQLIDSSSDLEVQSDLGIESKVSSNLARVETEAETRILPDVDWTDVKDRVGVELKEAWDCASIAADGIFRSNVTPEDIVHVCDAIDGVTIDEDVFLSHALELKRRSLEFQRYELLSKLLRKDYEAYVATASFLSPSRIAREELPNVQDVPMDKNAMIAS